MNIEALRAEWAHGEKAELARRCKIGQNNLNDLISGRRGISAELAANIETEAQGMGLALSRLDLLYPHESTNPLLGKGVSR